MTLLELSKRCPIHRKPRRRRDSSYTFQATSTVMKVRSGRVVSLHALNVTMNAKSPNASAVS